VSEHPDLITCTCPAPAGQVCPVPHDRWLSGGLVVRPLAQPYPCLCNRRGSCSPQWCPCAGRVDLENVPATCCAHVNTPLVVARAIHGGDYRTCWCRGDLDKHKTAAPVLTALPGLVRDPELDEEDED
jgi:hypothetical protein